MDVQDKPAEIGIKLQNILTSILIGVCAWVGTEIRTMGADIAEIKTDIAVDRTELNHLRQQFNQHSSDKLIHTMGHTHVKSEE